MPSLGGRHNIHFNLIAAFIFISYKRWRNKPDDARLLKSLSATENSSLDAYQPLIYRAGQKNPANGMITIYNPHLATHSDNKRHILTILDTISLLQKNPVPIQEQK